MIADVKYTYHAVKEVQIELEREMGGSCAFIPKEQAIECIKESMKVAKYLGEIMSDGGKIDRLFAYRRFCFVLDRYDDVVITVYKRENVHEEIRNLVQELLFDKLRELEKAEKLLDEERLAADVRLQLEVELSKVENIGACNLGGVRNEFNLRRELEGLENRLFHFRLRKSKIAKGIAAYL
jgi:hypothetical protein